MSLIPVLLPVFVAVGVGIRWIITRRDAKAEAKLKQAREDHAAELQAARDSRMAEREEMIRQREAFYLDIKSEVVRMRELYESEIDRGIKLRTALVQAGEREMTLQQTIMELTAKVDALQEMVARLQKELESRESWAQ